MSKPVPQSKSQVSILAQGYVAQARRYFDRHGYAQTPDLPSPDPELEIVVVIPAMAEPDVVTTLESLTNSLPAPTPVEVLLVINAACDAIPEIKRVNRQTLDVARDWAAQHQSRHFRCHVLDYRDLQAGHAGVGLARKLGLDAGLARLATTKSGRGILVSLDADCRVAASYFDAVFDFFVHQPQAVGATIHFEHPIEEAETRLRQAIVDYELHLRCYRHGLESAGSQYAFYAVGSAFAVRSEIYAQEGGMNRRAAGEDFYFLNKLLKRGQLGEICATTVFPAARVSDRVPFGTGAALRRSLDEPVTTYAPAIYRELRSFLDALHDAVPAGGSWPEKYTAFLDSAGFGDWLRKARGNAASAATLSDQLRRWLDGFRTMKFINWSVSEGHENVAVCDAAREILTWKNIRPAHGAAELLEQFRRLDRGREATDTGSRW